MNRFMLPPRRNPMLQCRKFLRLSKLRVFTQSRPTAAALRTRGQRSLDGVSTRISRSANGLREVGSSTYSARSPTARRERTPIVSHQTSRRWADQSSVVGSAVVPYDARTSTVMGGCLDAGPATVGGDRLGRCGWLFAAHGARRQRHLGGVEGPPTGAYCLEDP